MKRFAIIVGGGSGTRMNTPVPKQFMLLDGKPVLMQTLHKFAEADPAIELIVVLRTDQLDFWIELCKQHTFTVPHQLTDGGETRFQSVRNGLQLIREDGIIGVHDAARPLVSTKTILTAFKAAEMYGNAVPAIPLQDSIRQIVSGLSIAVDRTKYCAIQTPQCFSASILKKAYEQEYKYTFTDDASVVEADGEKIHLIDGNSDNIKITTPRDLIIADAILKNTKVISASNKSNHTDDLSLLS
ncbi:MAG: 2-C-methyl-D-erythritol 4-phosphate cytidylyltransferase [Bacteroidia bacterium]